MPDGRRFARRAGGPLNPSGRSRVSWRRLPVSAGRGSMARYSVQKRIGKAIQAAVAPAYQRTPAHLLPKTDGLALTASQPKKW